MDGDVVRRWMRACAETIEAQRDHLTQLDAAIGDADHGTNMTRGFGVVGARLAGLDDATPPGTLLTAAGATLISTVGGASGPLWGAGLRRAGRALGEAPQLAPAALADALDAVVSAVAELGAASVGDKTMLDALTPAAAALRASVAAGRPAAESLAAARAAATQGARSTIPLVARKGRASYLGARSAGHEDPGAASAALIVAALERAVCEP